MGFNSAFKELRKNTDRTILPADKGDATVILNTLDYKQITSLLEDPSYIRLARDPTDLTERKTTLLLKKYRQSVPKRRHIKFRRRGITQKKAYNIQNTA
jgi:hypothetical protein